MKKILIAIIAFVMLFTIKVYAAEVEITDIKCDNLYDGILKEDVNVEANGLNMIIDDTYFSKEGDYLRCSIKMTNSSEESVEVSNKEIEKLTTENITYSLSSDENNIIEKGKSKVFVFLAEYKKALSTDGEFDNVIEIKIINDTIDVPDTLVKSLVVLLITATSVVSIVLLIKTKNKAYVAIFAGAIFLLMPSAKALVNVTITVNSKIVVEVSERRAVTYAHEMVLTEAEAEAKAKNYISMRKYNAGTQEEPQYVKMVIDGTDYYIYDVVELDKNYLPGEVVNIKEMKMRGVDQADCTFDSETNAATCASVDDYFIYGWLYDGVDPTELGVDDLLLVDPKEYTMPDHDILFTQSYNHFYRKNLNVYYVYETYLTELEASSDKYDSVNKKQDEKYIYGEKTYYLYTVMIKDEGFAPGDKVNVRELDIIKLNDCAYDNTTNQNNCSTIDHINSLGYTSTNIKSMNFSGTGEITDGGCHNGGESCDNFIIFSTPMSFNMAREDVLLQYPFSAPKG